MDEIKRLYHTSICINPIICKWISRSRY